MIVVQHATATEFLTATSAFRAQNAAMTNILGSVATAVAEGRSYSAEFWYSIENDGEVVGCAMRTPPWLLAVSPMTVAAARELAGTLALVDPDLPGIVGPEQVARSVADALGRSGHLQISELVRVLGTYSPAPPTRGSARSGVPEDLELVQDWWVQFAADAGLPMHGLDTLPQQLLDMFASERLLLWEVDGAPVAMCGHASLVETSGQTFGRIGPVYTPAALRGHGYGTAVTGAMVEHMQPRCDAIMLFTDEANPTSNGIYAKLGFEVVGDIVEFAFDAS